MLEWIKWVNGATCVIFSVWHGEAERGGEDALGMSGYCVVRVGGVAGALAFFLMGVAVSGWCAATRCAGHGCSGVVGGREEGEENEEKIYKPMKKQNTDK